MPCIPAQQLIPLILSFSSNWVKHSIKIWRESSSCRWLDNGLKPLRVSKWQIHACSFSNRQEGLISQQHVCAYLCHRSSRAWLTFQICFQEARASLGGNMGSWHMRIRCEVTCQWQDSTGVCLASAWSTSTITGLRENVVFNFQALTCIYRELLCKKNATTTKGQMPKPCSVLEHYHLKFLSCISCYNCD